MLFFRFLLVCVSLTNLLSVCGDVACGPDQPSDSLTDAKFDQDSEKRSAGAPDQTEDVFLMAALQPFSVRSLYQDKPRIQTILLRPKQLLLATSSGLSPPHTV